MSLVNVLSGLMVYYVHFVYNVKSCVELNGIGDTTNGEHYYEISDLDNVWRKDIYRGIYLTSLDKGTDFIAHETSIQTRIIPYDLILYYNVLSMYEEIPLEFFGRKDISEMYRRCETSKSQQPSNLNTDLFYLHRSVALIYTVYYNVVLMWSKANDFVEEKLLSMGLDPYLCDDKNSNKFYKAKCNDPSTPWGLAYIFTQEMLNVYLSDGWNSEGAYNRGFNRVPYSDFREGKRRYIPKNTPWELKYYDKWQPLLEHDDIGFSFYQEHVTPHIGYTARSWVSTDDEICERSKQFKKNYGYETVYNYDYEKEIPLVFERLAKLNDLQKMEIEFFDRKNNLGDFLDAYLLGQDVNQATALLGGYDSFGMFGATVVYLLSVSEAAITVWKEKVDFDKVRPTSIIKEFYKDEFIKSYGGTTFNGKSLGTQIMLGQDFESFVRVMPHSEYPSGSACLCYSWADAMKTYFHDLNGLPDVSVILGEQGFEKTFDQYSSRLEPLSTPKTNLITYYKDWDDIAKRCSESRLEGGMHFTPSVDDGIKLCKNNVGSKVAKYMYEIVNGRTPEYTIDPTNIRIPERTCYPRKHGGDGKDYKPKPKMPKMDDDMKDMDGMDGMGDKPTKQPTEEPEYRGY